MVPNFTHQLNVAGIGEILWDLFPDYSRLGGAPANFAYHCGELGANSFPVTCIGDDSLGEATLTQLARRRSNSLYVAQSAGQATGRVNVSLDSDRKPTFDIQTDAAWDHLEFSTKLEELSGQLDAVCFGTLGQRSPKTREAIGSFIKGMPDESLKILDINLRAPFYSKALIEQSLMLANVLKLSDEELVILADMFDLEDDVSGQLRSLLDRYDLKLIAFTRGSKGSVLLDRYQYDECMAKPIEVVDSVGAGDAFTAALCVGLLLQWPLFEVNAFANRVAAFVCSKDGATPTLPTYFSELEVY